MKKIILTAAMFTLVFSVLGQRKKTVPVVTAPPPAPQQVEPGTYFKAAKWRNIGPFRGGRSVAASGVVDNPLVYYMGTVGGGVWKSEDAGISWKNISDGYFSTASVGAVSVAESDANVVYVGMGEHAPRGVMTSYGNGVYKSTDAGKTWTKMGLEPTRHISGISIHPGDPDLVYVAAQGALHGASEDRGVYKSADGGKSWKKVLYVDENTGCSDLSMDMTNPRILYAAMWDHRRLPWEVRSGGKGSGIYKSVDGGETWTRLDKGLPKELGKIGLSVSRANPNKVYAVIESDSQKEQGGVFVSDDAGTSWSRISKDHRTVQRAWYYIEIFADPQNENVAYVLAPPMLKTIDGGKTWQVMETMHGDHHGLWINPKNSKNMILADDGGAVISFNGGETWSHQKHATAQMYRINADNLFPYNVYGGQQDNTSVKIASRSTYGYSIGERDWTYSAGGESAFLAFNPDDPRLVLGGSYQGTIEVLDNYTMEGKGIMERPFNYLSMTPKNMMYRFNWNAPIIWSAHEPNTFYHGGNVLFKTNDYGKNWSVASPDLSRHDTTKMGLSGVPYTNEGAGGENYGTILYVKESPQEPGVIWVGSDDGLVHVTRDNCKTWTNVTPVGLQECMINCIEISPHDPATIYLATTRYKFNDFTPALYKSANGGQTWEQINQGIPYGAFTRVIREDTERKELLFAGTETGLYSSYDGGIHWHAFQLNLPVTPITDLKVHQGDLIAATAGRSFWIFDDLHLLRQLPAVNTQDQLVLFQPEPTYRVSGGSSMDRNISVDDNSTFNSNTAGTNPATGVVLYYQLPTKLDSVFDLKLEILTKDGQLIRSYANKADEKHESYEGAPPPNPVLPAKAGLNRAVWDMRYPILRGVPAIYIEGSYRGHKVPPGEYWARITYQGKSAETAIKIIPDPRINATEADYIDQHQMMMDIEKKINEMHDLVNIVRRMKKQIEDLKEKTAGQSAYALVEAKLMVTQQKLTAWEETIVPVKAQCYDDATNFENKFSGDYIFLKGEMDSNIPQVTKGQKEQWTMLNQRWAELKKQQEALFAEIKMINGSLYELDLPTIGMF